MTQEEIAIQLNISRSTVSLALANSPRIKAETAHRVRAYAKLANYQPNMSARSLVTGKTNLIGIILPSFENHFLSELSNELSLYLRKKNYSAIFSMSSDICDLPALLGSLSARRVDGIISYLIASDELLQFQVSGTPVVVYHDSGRNSLSYVDVDRYEGSRLLTRHLLATGHRSIAYIGELDACNPRFLGCRDVLLENNLGFEQNLLVDISGEIPEGVEGMRILLRKTRGKLPDAVMFHNDIMAIAGMTEAVRSGISVPEEMSITGFDNIVEASHCLPTLTTISQPKKEIAAELVNLLLRQIQEKNSQQPFQRHKTILTPTLVIRDSTRQRTSQSA